MINYVSKKNETERKTKKSGLYCQTSHCERENYKRIIKNNKLDQIILKVIF